VYHAYGVKRSLRLHFLYLRLPPYMCVCCFHPNPTVCVWGGGKGGLMGVDITHGWHGEACWDMSLSSLRLQDVAP
jgi:hypothetical protein